MLVMGDFNLSWGTQDSDCLKDFCNNLNLTQLITKPTCPNLKDITKSTIIDLVLSITPERFVASGVFSLDISDHYCLY